MPQVQLPNPLERKIFLARQVDQSSINEISKAIIAINEDDEYLKQLAALNGMEYKPKPIKLYIDSYGGQVYQCFGLLNIMDNSKTPLHTIVTGCAMSCGFMISINGHKRFAYKNSTLLYHQPSGGAIGTAQDMEESVKEIKRLHKLIDNNVLLKTKIKKERLKECKEKKIDWFINADEALKLGCIDEIL